jgi:tetratricopeptide (TPR) repeat protein
MRNRGGFDKGKLDKRNFDFDANKFGQQSKRTSWFAFIIFAVAVGTNFWMHSRSRLDADRTPEYMATTNAEEELAAKVADKKLENKLNNLPADSPKSYELYADRAYTLEAQKKFDQAEVYYKKMMAAAPYAYKTYDYNNRGEYEINYASMLAEKNRASEGVKVLEDTIAGQKKALGANSWVVSQTMASLASTLDAAKEYKREEAVLLDLAGRMETNKEVRDRLGLNILQNLGDCYNHEGRKEEAKATYEKGIAQAKAAHADIVTTYLEAQLKALQ